MVYNNWGQLAVYDNMGVALFVNGYLTGLGEESDEIKGFMLAHLQEVMEDADVYGWKCVRSYPLAWLQQIEQSQAAWGYENRKIKLRRALVWNRAPITTKAVSNTSATACQTTLAPSSKPS